MRKCAPDPTSWFARGAWPRCNCGYDPKNNTYLRIHWLRAGFRVVDNHGQLTMIQINKEES